MALGPFVQTALGLFRGLPCEGPPEKDPISARKQAGLEALCVSLPFTNRILLITRDDGSVKGSRRPRSRLLPFVNSKLRKTWTGFGEALAATRSSIEWNARQAVTLGFQGMAAMQFMWFLGSWYSMDFAEVLGLK